MVSFVFIGNTDKMFQIVEETHLDCETRCKICLIIAVSANILIWKSNRKAFFDLLIEELEPNGPWVFTQ